MPRIILKINQNNDPVICSDKIACYIVSSKLNTNKLQEIKPTEKMILAQGDDALSFCNENNLDGVVVEVDTTKPIKAQLKPLRESLKKKTLGVVIPLRRHEAMLSSEIEPEFVIFRIKSDDDSKEVIEWYNDLFLLPLALWSDQEISPLEKVMADFIVTDAEKFENSGC